MSTDAYRAFLRHGGFCDLSDRLLLSLTGADRVRYLNGQVTSNVTKLTPAQTQRACVTTAKGRLCGEVIITAAADELFIDADAALRDTLPPRLERYIVADDVTLEEFPASTRLVHFLGTDPRALAPFSALELRSSSRFGIDGWDWWTNADELTALDAQLREDFTALDEALLESIRIERGVPRWGRELGEETLPHEAGLDRTHIDFHKGCYIGQEVISRVESVGHVNRQLTAFVSENAPLAVGMQVFAESGAPVGTITSAAWSFALEKPVALGYLKRGAPQQGLTARAAEDDAANAVAISAQATPLVS